MTALHLLTGLELISPDAAVRLEQTVTGEPTITRSMDGGSVIVLTASDELVDGVRRLRQSGALSRSWVHLGPAENRLTFRLHRVEVDGEDVTLTFLDEPVKLLKAQRGRYVNPPGRSRLDFVRHLCGQVAVPVVSPDTAPPAAVAPERGTEQDPDGQDSWDAIRKSAEDVAWRAFSSGRALHIGPDDWLLTRQPAVEVQARTGPVGDITWTMDEGLDADTLTYKVDLPDDALPWGASPGQPVLIAGEGPADGPWLVKEYTGPLLGTGRRGTVTCERRQQALPEPVPDAAEDSGDTSTLAAAGPAGSGGSGAPAATGDRERFVQAALRRANGRPYLWGGSGPGAYDCSGLVQEAARDAGRVLGKPAASQSATVRRSGTVISVAEALRTRGALLFRIGTNPNHVAISLGDGRTVEARSRRDGCGVFGGAAGRKWTGGGVWL